MPNDPDVPRARSVVPPERCPGHLPAGGPRGARFVVRPAARGALAAFDELLKEPQQPCAGRRPEGLHRRRPGSPPERSSRFAQPKPSPDQMQE